MSADGFNGESQYQYQYQYQMSWVSLRVSTEMKHWEGRTEAPPPHYPSFRVLLSHTVLSNSFFLNHIYTLQLFYETRVF
jgi:hypothetical protein